jgi:hypothetical protein
MPCDIGNSLRNTFNWAFSSSSLNGVFTNVFYISGIIIFIIILIIAILIPQVSCYSMVRVMFYLCMTVIPVLFVHDGVLKIAYNNSSSDAQTDRFIDGIGTQIDVDKVKVAPNIQGGDNNQPVTNMSINDQINSIESAHRNLE